MSKRNFRTTDDPRLNSLQMVCSHSPNGGTTSTTRTPEWYVYTGFIWSPFSQRTALPQLGLLNAIQNIGCLAAYPFAPYVTDGAGRRSAVILGAFIMCAATIIQTASNSVNMFIGAR